MILCYRGRTEIGTLIMDGHDDWGMVRFRHIDGSDIVTSIPNIDIKCDATLCLNHINWRDMSIEKPNRPAHIVITESLRCFDNFMRYRWCSACCLRKYFLCLQGTTGFDGYCCARTPAFRDSKYLLVIIIVIEKICYIHFVRHIIHNIYYVWNELLNNIKLDFRISEGPQKI